MLTDAKLADVLLQVAGNRRRTAVETVRVVAVTARTADGAVVELGIRCNLSRETLNGVVAVERVLTVGIGSLA